MQLVLPWSIKRKVKHRGLPVAGQCSALTPARGENGTATSRTLKVSLKSWTEIQRWSKRLQSDEHCRSYFTSQTFLRPHTPVFTLKRPQNTSRQQPSNQTTNTPGGFHPVITQGRPKLPCVHIMRTYISEKVGFLIRFVIVCLMVA